LPLFGEATRAYNEAAPKIAASDQFLYEQTSHDRLPCPGIIREQETQRLAGQHRLVDGGNLVRERIHQRCMDSEHRVEEMSQTDAVRFRNESEECPVAVEAPRPAHLGYLKTRLVVSIEDLVRYTTVRSAIH